MHNNKHNFLGGHSARRSASSDAPITGAAAAPLHAPTAACSAPPFNPSATNSPPPPVLSSSLPVASTGFNINGAAASAAGGHQDNVNGSSSPQSA
uniref:Uncharacterized protein n=1 Tax=Arundo donax TaxID=35708 RepID=A0A0A9GEZ7_ARUDO